MLHFLFFSLFLITFVTQGKVIAEKEPCMDYVGTTYCEQPAVSDLCTDTTMRYAMKTSCAKTCGFCT
ncbi:hypothetical protein Y032_0124g1220 [Ancylostoma ceylanicum]|uniref:ShKT domain-containing protein n=1 Tax=Ancylostoma ceylanicum TaxID=53326 RepID=A0A016T975_9BILA|nr:hypothetical protein Y032_0124g1220 [Ancylostoma ceylanicum]